jgi:hypothetical protein
MLRSKKDRCSFNSTVLGSANRGISVHRAAETLVDATGISAFDEPLKVAQALAMARRMRRR